MYLTKTVFKSPHDFNTTEEEYASDEQWKVVKIKIKIKRWCEILKIPYLFTENTRELLNEKGLSIFVYE